MSFIKRTIQILLLIKIVQSNKLESIILFTNDNLIVISR